MKSSRTLSFIIIAIIYIAAFLVGWVTYKCPCVASWHVLWRLLIADVVATVFVWIFGLIFKNVSVYDPYWSVAPPVMMTAYACQLGSWSGSTVLLLIAVWWWGVYLMFLSVTPNIAHDWFWLIGAVMNTLLFCFISIPLMEGRQLKNKPEYAEYKKHTRRFV